MAKRYGVFCDSHGRWYVETQEDTAVLMKAGASEPVEGIYFWVIAAGPFDDEDKAWDALDKMRED